MIGERVLSDLSKLLLSRTTSFPGLNVFHGPKELKRTFFMKAKLMLSCLNFKRLIRNCLMLPLHCQSINYQAEKIR